jgi:hypothetical protein
MLRSVSAYFSELVVDYPIVLGRIENNQVNRIA